MIKEILAPCGNLLVCVCIDFVDLETGGVVRRICHYILFFKASIEAELSSLTREKKEYCKVQDVFVQEDGMVDWEACRCLGRLLQNQKITSTFEINCCIYFQGKGAKREIGVSLATAITEASVQKFIQVLHGKLNAEPVVTKNLSQQSQLSIRIHLGDAKFFPPVAFTALFVYQCPHNQQKLASDKACLLMK